MRGQGRCSYEELANREAEELEKTHEMKGAGSTTALQLPREKAPFFSSVQRLGSRRMGWVANFYLYPCFKNPFPRVPTERK